MNITTMFKLIKAPLKNQRWSWGSYRPDGTIVLRVGQHEISNGLAGLDTNSQNEGHGKDERREHVAAIEAGAACYVVTVISSDPHNPKANIVGFNKRELWYGKEVVYVDGKAYLKLIHRVAIGELL